MPAAINISGVRFGSLIANSDIGPDKRKQRIWSCTCDCGNVIHVAAGVLRNGNTKSCGCLKAELAKQRFTKHGAKVDRKPTPEYVSWSLMRDRCNNHNNPNFNYYGGRGISVAKEWDDFNVFLADMGQRPNGSTIERIDSNGNYEPVNCRWATRKEQARNRAYCRRVLWDGQERLLWELADEHKVPVHIVHQRLHQGWDLNRTLTQPIKGMKNV
jgi:hypothetical protein